MNEHGMGLVATIMILVGAFLGSVLGYSQGAGDQQKLAAKSGAGEYIINTETGESKFQYLDAKSAIEKLQKINKE